MANPMIDNLNPTLRQIALRIVAESGGRVTISSGWRSNAQQTSLYNRWKSGQYNVPAVARPGTSNHEHGMAVDFGGDLQLAQQLGRKYGLIFPVRGEAWHGELGEGVQDGGQTGQFGIQYNLNYEGPEQAADPQEVIANRLHAVNRILGLDPLTGAPGAGEVMEPMNDVLAASPEVVAPTEVPEAGARTDQPLDIMGQMQDQPVQTLDINEQGTASYSQGNKGDFQRYAYQQLGRFGLNPEEMSDLITLWNKESGWNPLAQNPSSSAFGIAQFLDGTWKGTGIAKTTNPNRQIDAGLMYIKGRYGSIKNALQFHLRNNWY